MPRYERPGATNLVTGIATAYMDSIPMVAITGNVGTSLIGRDSFQEVYIAGITMPITKHNFVVRHVEELADTVREAFRIAQSGRPGPVLIDIPKDVTAATTEFIPKSRVEVHETYDISEEQLKTVADMIGKAERPVHLLRRRRRDLGRRQRAARPDAQGGDPVRAHHDGDRLRAR